MTYKNLLIQLKGGILKITINREAKLNALNKETLAELHQAITEAIQNEQVKGMLLNGAGDKAFVAGADIRELSKFDSDEGRSLANEGQTKVFDVIHHSEKPIIAAINGFALGGGLELALACHIRVAAHTAQLGLPEVSLGLIPGYGGTQRLTQLVGRGNALEMILTGDRINAEKAYRIGLVNWVVPADEVLAKATEILERIMARSSSAIAAAIKAVNASLTVSEDGYKVEMNEFSKCFDTADFKEGVNAFLEKRNPKFE